ncbi:outer membrane beta-barrel protein [Alcanivorax sediminis]|uniref:Outer membrane protein beta-barrel domain-containing protein n=1 Tax=Alcanivorax sediminis TaxID=2663008 RepID=A0A6N7LQL8_9GAMM|nr:outer membrane beta-barrel protein [Alcanivorax sediminis]MQX52413.1 hypothetical protein [Alcanivorax sediminis]
MKILLPALIAAATCAVNAWAETSAPASTQSGGFMLGAGLGFDSGNFSEELEDELAFIGPGFDVDDDGADIGKDLYLGYVFGGASSFRFGYREFGEQSGDVTYFGNKTGDYVLEADGVYMAVDLLLPLNETLFVGGTLGLQNWDGKVTARNAFFSSTESTDGRDFFYGLRGKLLVNEGRGALVAGYSLYSFEDEYGEELEYNSLSIGFEGYFR